MPGKARADMIRRIQETGYLREIDPTHLLNLPKLTIENDFLNSMVFEFLSGSGLILDLRIITDRPTHIQEFGAFELAGHVWDVDWWVEEDSPVYRFYKGPEYPRDIVLNHRIAKQGVIKPGIPMEGVLLGRCQRPVPPALRPFDLPISLSIVDGFQTCHSGNLSMRFDHDFCIRPTRRTSSLFTSGESMYKCAPRKGAEPDENAAHTQDLPLPKGPSSGTSFGNRG